MDVSSLAVIGVDGSAPPVTLASAMRSASLREKPASYSKIAARSSYASRSMYFPGVSGVSGVSSSNGAGFGETPRFFAGVSGVSEGSAHPADGGTI
jgi:hypothetical protein